MERTYEQLKAEGILRIENGQMVNAVSECYVSGGEKGLWIDGKFWRRVTRRYSHSYEAPELSTWECIGKVAEIGKQLRSESKLP